jgi:hypothetical protein
MFICLFDRAVGGGGGGLTRNISRGHNLPKRAERGNLLLIIRSIYFMKVTIYSAASPHNISRGHYLPCKVYCLVLACIEDIIHIRLLSFCHDVANM